MKTVSEVWDAAGDPQREPNLDYHNWKFDLYRIMGPFLGRRVQTNRLESIERIHTKLLIWWRDLPQSLRLGTYEGGSTPAGSPLLPMQALALQLTYDNIQIVLHRSVAFQPHAAASVLAHTNISANPTMCAVSREQLLESALRTSDVYKFPNLLLACRKTHAAMHVGICLFTAGVVLCALAFSDPLSTTSQNAKRGVMNILRLQHNHALGETLLSTQSLKIIEELVAAVMRSEQHFIRGDIDKSSPPSSLSSNADRLPNDDRIINNHASVVTQDNPSLDTTSRELSGGLLDQLPGEKLLVTLHLYLNPISAYSQKTHEVPFPVSQAISPPEHRQAFLLAQNRHCYQWIQWLGLFGTATTPICLTLLLRMQVSSTCGLTLWVRSRFQTYNERATKWSQQTWFEL